MVEYFLFHPRMSSTYTARRICQVKLVSIFVVYFRQCISECNMFQTKKYEVTRCTSKTHGDVTEKTSNMHLKTVKKHNNVDIGQLLQHLKNIKSVQFI